MPAINALSAGNSCVIKPSEHVPATSQLLEVISEHYFSPEHLAVVTGDAEVAKQLISLKFELLFFTGSSIVGSNVFKQAAEHLTPVVMELGSRSPCIIDETGFSSNVIKEIVWGKFLNAGQTCIAPNTLYVHHSLYEQTLSELKEAVINFYGDNPKTSSDYGRLIHQQHFDNVERYMSNGTIYHGGETDRDNLFIAPTLLTEAPLDSDVLQEEIFGPILPVVPYTDLESLLESGQIHHDALVAYLFSKSPNQIAQLSKYMKSTLSVNQVIHHAASPNVAFGGIGSSGFGAYHGKSAFDECSYERVYYRAYYYKRINKKYPPYSEGDVGLMKKLRRWLF